MNPLIIVLLFMIDSNYSIVLKNEISCRTKGGIAVGRYKQTCLQPNKKAMPK